MTDPEAASARECPSCGHIYRPIFRNPADYAALVAERETTQERLDYWHGEALRLTDERDQAVAERDKLLNEGIHAAVSFTYIDGEAARIKARVALKNAAGWPLSDGEMERLAALAVSTPATCEKCGGAVSGAEFCPDGNCPVAVSTP